MAVRFPTLITFQPGGFYGVKPLTPFPFAAILARYRDDSGKLHRRVLHAVTTDDAAPWPDEVLWARIIEWTPVDLTAESE
jgi:hypothetical protein